MTHYLYLFINFLTVIVCFLFSFHPKIRFYRYFVPFLKSSCLVAVFFVIWDAWFAAKGVWWFNERYTLGIRLFGLPLEELLFFICIPFSCIFTYFCLNLLLSLRVSRYVERVLVICSMLFAFCCCLFFSDRLYTLITFCAAFFSLGLLYFVLKVDWIGKASAVYSVLLIGFFMVNGVLTGTGLEEPVVYYNPQEFIGIRMLTIPAEDMVYGYVLFIWNVFFFRRFSNA